METKYIEIVSDNRIHNLEYEWINWENNDSPTIIFLHEGLGSLAMWKGFPRELCARAKYRGLVYSRRGTANQPSILLR